MWGAPYWDEEEGVADAVAKLNACATAASRRSSSHGPDWVATSRAIQRVNAEVDLNIIVACGLYAFLEMPNFLAYRSDEVITEIFVREIPEGIDETGVKAAFLKCAVEQLRARR